jgi:two-component system, response regulator YesN
MGYKVLLADDEKIIVDGISSVIDWGSLDTELVATARNGIDAYEKISELQPDIVISDIRMPGMDGLTLVSKVHKEFPAIRFILLSGFSEFEYAQKAMQYGVKNYLLKPCNEGQITDALAEILSELREEGEHDTYLRQLRDDYEKAQPYLKAQLLTEFLSGKTSTAEDLEAYQQLFGQDISTRRVRLILFQLEGEFSYDHLYAIKNIGEEILSNLVLNTHVGEYALFLTGDQGGIQTLYNQIAQMRERLLQNHGRITTAAISEADFVKNARSLYRKAQEYLEHRFYFGEGSIITSNDIQPISGSLPPDMMADVQQICLKIKSGHMDDVRTEVDTAFRKMAALRLGIPLTKSYCIQLYLEIVKAGDSERKQDYLTGTSGLLGMETVQQMHDYIEEAAVEMTREFYLRFQSKQSSAVNRVIEIVKENLGNPELSLKMVASEMLYMNPDYLGKLFKQETGQRFSAYLTKLRIEKAVEHILECDDVKVVALAEMIGFGDNPQYFSQVFKKYTGYSPSEYRKVN